MMNNAWCNEGSPDDGKGDKLTQHSTAFTCARKFQARLLISASESAESGGPPAKLDNAAVMRVLLIEMYGPRLTAFRCYTN